MHWGRLCHFKHWKHEGFIMNKLSTATANRLFQQNLQIQADFFDNLVTELKSTNFPD